MTKSEILFFLKEKKAYLKEQFNIDSVGLFGSYARNEATAQSDIDLAIVTKTKSFQNRYKLKAYLEKEFQKPVDVGYLDSLRTFIRKEIQEEIIYV